MIQLETAKGVHRIEDAYTNWYLVEEDKRLTVVDTGTRSSWTSLQAALKELGRSSSDISAVVLTHGHFDHLGFAERARTELNVPVWIHHADVSLTKNPLSYEHERSRAPYLLRPKAMPIVGALMRDRAFWPTPLEKVQTYDTGTLDVPGSPRIISSPGHTHGHCALHLPDRDVLIAGDAVVTLNPYTGNTGPQIVAGAATANSALALESLDALAETGASTVLTGHGAPWTGGIREAVRLAKEAGPS